LKFLPSTSLEVLLRCMGEDTRRRLVIGDGSIYYLLTILECTLNLGQTVIHLLPLRPYTYHPPFIAHNSNKALPPRLGLAVSASFSAGRVPLRRSPPPRYT